MKDTFQLFPDEKFKLLGKSILKSAGFSDSELRKHLNFSESTIARADRKVANAKFVFPDMWKTAFRMVCSRFRGRSDKHLLPKAKRVMNKLGAGDLLSRTKSQFAHRPRIDIDAKILETIVEISATSSHSGLLTHAKRHYEVKYLESVKESVETNQKLSAARLREQYNLFARETGVPTASISTLKRRCLASHSGHKNSQHYFNEAKIKFGKVPDTGTSIPSINLQYCRAFVKMEQRKPFRFDERFPHLREYSTINSTDAKAPVILGSKNSFDVGRTWLSYVSEDDRWNQLLEEDESDVEGCKRERSADGKVVPLQALPCHDYHSGRDFIVPNTYLFIEKKFTRDAQSGRESVCWSGSKRAVIVSPKFEYSSGALNHINERYQLRRYGDKEVQMKMTFGHTDVPSVSLRYLLVQIRSWMQSVKEKEHLSKYVTNPDAIEALKLSSFVSSLSRQLFHVPTPPIPLIPLYSGNPSEVFQRVFHTLREERLRRLDSAIGTAQEAYTIVLALKSTLLQNGLQDCSFEVENVGKVKIVSVLQRLIDHVIIRKTGFPFNEQVTSFSSLSGLSVLTKATKLLNELTVAPDAKGDKGTVYLKEMNGASLMLEIVECLESNKDISLSTPTTTSSACLDVEELMGEYSQLAGAIQIQLACEPRPFNC